MAAEALLESDSYGLGVEKLWRFADNKEIKKLGYQSPGKLRPMFYEHEKAHGEVFVSLALCHDLNLNEWERAENQFLRNDGHFMVGDDFYFLEVEMDNHGAERLTEKVDRYRAYYRETQERFSVLFVFQTEAKRDAVIDLFGVLKVTKHYRAVTIEEIKKPKNVFLNTV